MIRLVLVIAALVGIGGAIYCQSPEVSRQIAAADSLGSLGRNSEAIRLLNDLLAQGQGRFSNEDMGALSHKLGVYHYLDGSLGPASRSVSSAIGFRAQTGGYDLANSYYLRAAVNRESRNLLSAKTDLAIAIQTWEPLAAGGDQKSAGKLADAYFEMVKTLNVQGDYALALVFWDKVYAQTAGDPVQLPQLLNTRGAIHGNRGEYSAAISYFRNALESAQRLPEPDKVLEAEISNNLCVAYLKKKDISNARRSGEQAVRLFDELFEETQSPYFQQEKSNTQASLIEIYSLLENEALVDQTFNSALQIGLQAWGSAKHPRIAQLYLNHATHFSAQNRPAQALAEIDRAVGCLDRFNDDPDRFSIRNGVFSDPLLLLDLLGLKAVVLSRNTDNRAREEALTVYLQIDSLAAGILNAYRGAGSKYTLLQKTKQHYDRACRLALDAFQDSGQDAWVETAYQFASRNKAFTLVQGINDENAKKFAGVPDKTLGSERKIKKAIYDLENRIQAADPTVSGRQISNLRDSLFVLKTQYLRFIENLEKSFPSYFELKFAFQKPVDLNSIRSGLKDRELLVEYFFGESDIYVFYISKNGVGHFVAPKTAELSRAFQLFRQGSKAESAVNKNNFEGAAFLIYNQLLRKALKEKKPERLILIPDDELLTLPFEALVTAPAGQYPGKKPPFLLKDYNVRYVYSNRLLLKQDVNRRKNRAAKRFAGFGLEYDDFTLNGVEKLMGFPLDSVFLSRTAGKLEYSDDEVLEVAGILNGQTWVNSEATLPNFLNSAPNYQIIHLAMHNVINEDSPLNSTLVFSRTADSSEFLLKTADLFWLQLKADLAVLSACNTGMDLDEQGDGFRSMAQGFLYAGCGGIVASLWNASDRSSRDILVHFYRFLEEGKSKDEALRLAKLRYLEEAPPAFSHPFYWSHFVLIGDSDPLGSNRTGKSRPLLLISLVVLASLMVGVWAKRRKN